MTSEARPFFREGLLSGRVGLVTGGGTGIGRAITLELARAGMDIAIASRKLDHLSPTRVEVEALGRRCIALECDVRDPARVEAMVGEVKARLGGLDLLVNNAAGNFPAPALAISANGFKAVLEIDLLGSFLCAKAAFPMLSERKGCVIHITATLSERGMPMQSHAGPAKAALDALTRHLAVEWGPAGIRVVAIAPGPVDETEGMRRLAGDPEVRSRLEQSIPIGRLGRVDDIAHMAVFLASDAASWITGATFVVDGGQRLGMSVMP